MAEINPNQILAERIFEKLYTSGLITETGKEQFIKQLSEGKLNESSWRVALEEPIKSDLKSSEHETPKT